MQDIWKKINISIVLIVAVSMLLASCTPAVNDVPDPVADVDEPAGVVDQDIDDDEVVDVDEVDQPEDIESRTLTIAVSADITGWDPATSIYWLANEVIINTHDTLVDFGPAMDEFGNQVRDITNITPNLAESWDEVGLQEFTFYLRENAEFTNGDPVTAQAVKDSFVRALGIPGLTSFLLADVAFLSSADQMEVLDDYTIKFTLPDPNPMFLKIFYLNNMAIVNVAEIEANGETAEEQENWAALNPTGSGPYLLDNFVSGVELVLKANPNYWGETAYYDTVIYKIVPDVSNRLLLLRNGDVDIIYEAPLKDIEMLEADPNIQTFTTPTFGTVFFWLGADTAPWSNLLVRQAIAHAIPYESIVNDVTYGYAIPATSWMPVGLEGHIDASPYNYDLDMARELLIEAGFPDGEGLPPITFYAKQGVPEEEQVIVYIQAELAKIGIQLDIQPVALAAHSEILASHQEELFAFNFWIPYVPDPVYSLYWNFVTADSGCCNYGSYSNSEVDELILAGLTEQNPDEYIRIIEEVQRIVASELPSVPLYHPSWNIAMLNNVQGYSYYPDTLLRFSQLYE